MQDSSRTAIDVTQLMDTPDGRDEMGTPDSEIAECAECGTLHRRGGAHRCTDGWVGR
ncbi:hypothetical protein [Natrinema pallidum]|uniref:hypothetical protein n=1 Tax=Natrinema pallidum TaxID=69527 RepID=UPI001375DBEE|nr:hypothetical protein [Natrinema pallidum]